MSRYYDNQGDEMTLADVMDETDICFPGEHSLAWGSEQTGDTHCTKCGTDVEAEDENIDVAYWQALLADENLTPTADPQEG